MSGHGNSENIIENESSPAPRLLPGFAMGLGIVTAVLVAWGAYSGETLSDSGDFFVFAGVTGYLYILFSVAASVNNARARWLVEGRRLRAEVGNKLTDVPIRTFGQTFTESPELENGQSVAFTVLHGNSDELGRVKLARVWVDDTPELLKRWSPALDAAPLEVDRLLEAPMPDDPHLEVLSEGRYRLPCGDRGRHLPAIALFLLPWIVLPGVVGPWMSFRSEPFWEALGYSSLLVLIAVAVSVPLFISGTRAFARIVIDRGADGPRYRRYFLSIPLERWKPWGPEWTLNLIPLPMTATWTEEFATMKHGRSPREGRDRILFKVNGKGPSLSSLIWLTAKLRADTVHLRRGAMRDRRSA